VIDDTALAMAAVLGAFYTLYLLLAGGNNRTRIPSPG
jgi:hypothetical protein